MSRNFEDSPSFFADQQASSGVPSSETKVKRGERIVGFDKELIEKLGGKDPCPCGSGRRFQTLLPIRGLLRWRHGPLLRAGLATRIDVPLFAASSLRLSGRDAPTAGLRTELDCASRAGR